MFTRRNFIATGSAAMLAACDQPAPPLERPAAQPQRLRPLRETAHVFNPSAPPNPAFYDAVTDEPYPVHAIPQGIVPPHLWRQQVPNPYPALEKGTIVIDPNAGMLHFVEGPETAMRYGAGTGRQAFSWQGDARLQFWREWPRWKVPQEMIDRDPSLAPYSVQNGGMDPGPPNPLGARALYLFQNGQDTLYRIHGACEPEYLGKSVSSGCIRLLDQDAIDLQRRAIHGATVRVLPSVMPEAISRLY